MVPQEHMERQAWGLERKTIGERKVKDVTAVSVICFLQSDIFFPHKL